MAAAAGSAAREDTVALEVTPLELVMPERPPASEESAKDGRALTGSANLEADRKVTISLIGVLLRNEF